MECPSRLPAVLPWLGVTANFFVIGGLHVQVTGCTRLEILDRPAAKAEAKARRVVRNMEQSFLRHSSDRALSRLALLSLKSVEVLSFLQPDAGKLTHSRPFSSLLTLAVNAEAVPAHLDEIFPAHMCQLPAPGTIQGGHNKTFASNSI